MIAFEKDGTQFTYRVAAVILDTGRILLHKAEAWDFWALPGGRVEIGETAAEAIRRELYEEMETQVHVGRLLWVVENFFELRSANHELGLYFEVFLPPDYERLDERCSEDTRETSTSYFGGLTSKI